MFSFPPLSETDCLNLLPPGQYDFVVKEAIATHSKSSGKPMMKLTLGVYDKNGAERIITDYLLDSIMYKVRGFAYSVGLENQYEAGGFLEKECVNRVGKCEIIIDEPEPGSKYSSKNVIKKYIKKDPSDSTKTPQVDQNLNDDLPF